VSRGAIDYRGALEAVERILNVAATPKMFCGGCWKRLAREGFLVPRKVRSTERAGRPLPSSKRRAPQLLR
jgi:hypothetical protein